MNNILNKNYIQFNLFNYVAFVFIIKKFKNKLRVCINYRLFNILIIKNRNNFLLIKKTFARLYTIKYFIKLNVIVIFNKIRIIEKNKHKTAFLIKYNLYKYVVILFNLCNIFEIFQFYINNILQKYLNDFCNVYLNDVLIYSNIKKKHIIYIRKIFVKLKTIKLYLNINKYEFYVNKIK